MKHPKQRTIRARVDYFGQLPVDPIGSVLRSPGPQDRHDSRFSMYIVVRVSASMVPVTDVIAPGDRMDRLPAMIEHRCTACA